jgi:PPOX class probable F420-dependent enzyme
VVARHRVEGSGKPWDAEAVLAGMELSEALDHARSTNHGVLVTLKKDGRPQLSNIVYALGDDGTIRISITADRAKAKNLAREPRASLYVGREDFWAYVVLEGDAELSDVASSPDDPAVDELIEVYRAAAGEHDDWDEYRAAMVRDQRLVVRLRPTHAYGAWR